jgi:hypothetical protein
MRSPQTGLQRLILCQPDSADLTDCVARHLRVILESRRCLGEHQKRKILETRLAIFWQNQTRTIRVRIRGSPERVSSSERHRRVTMAVNLRLTHAVKDRAVQKFQVNASEVMISFVDGSTMTVTIAECNSLPIHEGARMRQVQRIRQRFCSSVKTKVPSM